MILIQLLRLCRTKRCHNYSFTKPSIPLVINPQECNLLTHTLFSREDTSVYLFTAVTTGLKTALLQSLETSVIMRCIALCDRVHVDDEHE